MLCAPHTTFTGLPACASLNIPIICSSLNRLLFILFSSFFFRQNSNYITSTFPGAGQENLLLFSVSQTDFREWRNPESFSPGGTFLEKAR